jgi:hypothetical protein
MVVVFIDYSSVSGSVGAGGEGNRSLYQTKYSTKLSNLYKFVPSYNVGAGGSIETKGCP